MTHLRTERTRTRTPVPANTLAAALLLPTAPGATPGGASAPTPRQTGTATRTPDRAGGAAEPVPRTAGPQCCTGATAPHRTHH